MLIRIIQEVEKCIQNKCNLAALQLALALPDICGQAAYPKEGVSVRYIRWFDENVSSYEKTQDDRIPYLSGEIVYNLRNRMFHQGTPDIDTKKVKEERCKVDTFYLILDDMCFGGVSSSTFSEGGDDIYRSMDVNAVNLCFQLCRAAEGYYRENKEKFNLPASNCFICQR